MGSSVPSGHVDVRLRFNSRIDQDRSRLTLTAPDRSQARLAIGPSVAPEVMVTAAYLPPGGYVLRWQVLAVDGHITRGDVPFTVVAR